jgi:hypothetical protein
LPDCRQKWRQGLIEKQNLGRAEWVCGEGIVLALFRGCGKNRQISTIEVLNLALPTCGSARGPVRGRQSNKPDLGINCLGFKCGISYNMR